MSPAVHVLATCRNPNLWKATTLFLDTIRIGFPTFQIFVEGNNLDEDLFWELQEICIKIGAVSKNNLPTVHHVWISDIIREEEQPFYICDTDMVFHENFEKFDFTGEALAGRRIRRFYDEVTGCITYERLHTSLLYIDPVLVRSRVSKFKSRLCQSSPFYVDQDLVDPVVSIIHKQPYFHDTTSQLYNAIGGREYTERHLDCFDHLNCGTYIDIASQRMTYGKRLKENHEEIFSNPSICKGMWRLQEKYYERFAA